MVVVNAAVTVVFMVVVVVVVLVVSEHTQTPLQPSAFFALLYSTSTCCNDLHHVLQEDLSGYSVGHAGTCRLVGV